MFEIAVAILIFSQNTDMGILSSLFGNKTKKINDFRDKVVTFSDMLATSEGRRYGPRSIARGSA